MRIIVIGNGELATRLAKAVARSRHTLLAVVDDGRFYSSFRRSCLHVGAARWSSKSFLPYWAHKIGVPLLYMDRLDGELAKGLATFQPDVILVGGLARRLPDFILDISRMATMNCHLSLLPRYRGADPVAAVILGGDLKTGVTFHQMDQNFDTGPVFAQFSIDTSPEMNWPMLCTSLCGLAADQVAEVLDGIASGVLPPVSQDEAKASCAPMLKVADSYLDWRESAVGLERRVRAFAGSIRPRFVYRSRAVYVTRVRVVTQQDSEHAPGTILNVGPPACVATGEGVLEVSQALTYWPVPMPWPAPWSGIQKGEVLSHPLER